eukprot:218518_1
MITCADEHDDIGGVWIEIPLTIFPVIVLQILWLYHTVHTEYTRHKTSTASQAPNKAYKFQRTLHLSLQIVGLCWTINDVLSRVIDPHTLILRNNIGCYIAAYIPKVVPGVFYGLYFYQIVFRLEASFGDSFLAMSKTTTIILKLLIIPIVTGPIWIILLSDGACVRPWKPLDVPSWYDRPEPYQFAYCHLIMRSEAVIVLLLTVLWGGSINIIYGIVYILKLRVLLSPAMNESTTYLTFVYKSLIVKNAILTITGTITTLSCYVLWISLSFTSGLYIDLFVNCLMIGLMFKYNSKLYKRLCKCCIVVCFVTCDKSKSKLTKENVDRYVNDELRQRVTITAV